MPFPLPPWHNFPRRRGSRRLDFAKWFVERRPRPRDLDQGGVPVEPNRPNNLSGGAAAELEFDD